VLHKLAQECLLTVGTASEIHGTLLLENLTGRQLFKEFPVFYRTWNFITVFTTACHLSLSWTKLNQCMLSHKISLIFILFSHPYQGLPSGFCPIYFPTKTIYTPLLLHACQMPRLSHSSGIDYTKFIWCGVRII